MVYTRSALFSKLNTGSTSIWRLAAEDFFSLSGEEQQRLKFVALLTSNYIVLCHWFLCEEFKGSPELSGTELHCS